MWVTHARAVVVAERFEVTLDELVASAASARAAADGVAEVEARVRALLGDGSATGDAACAAAFDAMTGLWADQLVVMSEQTLALGRTTETAEQSYDATESTTSGMFGPR